MALKPLALGTQSGAGFHPHLGVARLVNCAVEQAGREGRVEYPLRVVSGLGALATLPAPGGVGRMFATAEGQIIVKAGRTVYSVDSLGTATVLGGFPVDGFVTMARNTRPSGEQVAVCAGGIMAIVSGGVMSTVDDADLGVPNSVIELGGYFITTEAGGQSRASELQDGTTWDGLSVERIGRDLLVGAPRGRDAVMFGSRVTHIWTLNDGAGSFPISPRSTLDFGTLAAGAVVEAGGTLYWLSTTDQGAYAGVRVLNGDTSQEIANAYVDRTVARETSKGAITTTTWTEEGRTFVAWSGTDWTHVLDLRTGQWHERSSLIAGAASRWRVAQTVQLGDRIIAGNATTPELYLLGHAYHDEAGTELVMTVQPPPLTAWPGRVEINELYLDVLPGVGLATGASQDVAPEVEMQWSSDGETFSTGLRRSLGRQGQTGRRVRFDRLGTRVERDFRFMASAKVVRGIAQAMWDGEVLGP